MHMSDYSSPIGFGIIGAGAVSVLHATAIAQCPDARLVAVADTSLERARKLAGEEAVCYDDYHQLLANPAVQAVCICTPSGLRGQICIDAAHAGKHILAEKPLEVTLEKTDAMIAACDAAQVKLAVVFQLRFMPGVQALKQAITAGRLGKLLMGDAYIKWRRTADYYASAPWRGTLVMDGGGVLINQAIHSIDLLQWLMGTPTRITGHTARLVHTGIEGEDTAVAALQFANGALGTIEACTSASVGLPARVEIRGTHGMVVLEDGKIALWEVEGEDSPQIETMDLGSGSADPMAIGAAGHLIHINDLVQAIRTDRPPIIDGREGRKALEVVIGIYRSAAAGQPVTLPL
jgi:UDP-N-acetyl-2-amino-2-deoxyglucuronate dehydrogenase